MESKHMTKTYPHTHTGMNMISSYKNKDANHEEAVQFKMVIYWRSIY
jgi:hypothetical protein